MLSIRFPLDIEIRLNNLTMLTKRTKSFYIREAVERSLEELEDLYLTNAALEHFHLSGEAAIPYSLEELEEHLGLVD